MTFRPMLAAELNNLADVKFPVLASPKLDGIRCVIRDGKALTRSLKPIPNDHIRLSLEGMNLPDFDGEILIRTVPGKTSLEGTLAEWAATPFNAVSSAVMSKQGRPDFLYAVFDQVDSAPYQIRLSSVATWCLQRYQVNRVRRVRSVRHVMVNNVEQLEALNLEYLSHGFEGIMIRNPGGMYKFGRSTVKEGGLLKLKPFADGEAEIIGYVERQQNTNQATVNALGLTERSHKAEGMVGSGTLGTLRVCGSGGRWDGVEFEIGTGFDDRLRRQIWEDQAYYLGAVVKFKYQEMGSVDRPRIPVFLGFRNPADL